MDADTMQANRYRAVITEVAWLDYARPRCLEYTAIVTCPETHDTVSYGTYAIQCAGYGVSPGRAIQDLEYRLSMRLPDKERRIRPSHITYRCRIAD